MKLTKLYLLLLVVSLPMLGRATTGANFDEGWKFFKGDAPGAEKPGFADSKWRKLDLPHDWSIEGTFEQTNKTGGAGAFLPSGVGWYRKHFVLPSEQKSKLVFIEFDGVMQNSEVWINGVSLGKRPFGYVSFGCDLTPHVKFGKGETNVIAVRADTSAQPASRWYSGAGIYRHVRLLVTDLVHIEPWGVFVTTPSVTGEKATVSIQTAITNSSNKARNILVRTKLIAPDGNEVASIESDTKIVKGKTESVRQQIIFPAPQLWNLDSPKLYRVVSQVLDGKKILDEVVTPFGVRQFEFKADSGFWLNGKNFKLYGVCLHHDGSAFGAAVPNAVWERRLNALRELGCNAIRTAHNPPSPDFLDLCDRMGFLVMDEFFDCWTVKKNSYDYSLFFNEWSKRDAAETIRRDRNHPSVILYSVGNEIHDTPKEELAKGILKGLVEVCHENDPTRPVTQALFRPNVSHDYDNGLADMLDVIGTNYRDNELLAAQRNKPERKIVGTEQRHDRQTWLWLRDNPSHSGQFLWTGVDYLGETRSWPLVGHASGLLDRTAVVKPMAFERLSWWSDKPVVRAVRRAAQDDVMPEDPGYGGEERHTQVQYADWTPRKLEAHDENVEVYSNCEEVELFLNDKSWGSKPINVNASPRNWKVAFEPGTLKAVAKNNGKVVATYELRTAGKPTKILLTSDRQNIAPTWDDVSFVTATVVDENGIVVPRANDLISFKVSGPGVIAAVDSADNASHEPFQASKRRAFQGRCEAAVKATSASGGIVVKASAPRLKEATVIIEAKSAK